VTPGRQAAVIVVREGAIPDVLPLPRVTGKAIQILSIHLRKIFDFCLAPSRKNGVTAHP
jgi:hypothetical protein